MDYDSVPDAALMRLIETDPSGVLGELYDRYSRLVFSIALKSLGSYAAAEEVTQEVFLQIWTNARAFRPEQGKLISWLTSIARYRSIDRLRRRSARPEGYSQVWAGSESWESSGKNELEREVDLLQQKQLIRRAVDQLPEEQREALALAYFSGYSHRQIAEILDTPLGTVKTRIRLAMQKLRLALRDQVELE